MTGQYGWVAKVKQLSSVELGWVAKAKLFADRRGSTDRCISCAGRNLHRHEGHNYIGHEYVGHNYTGHNHVGHGVTTQATTP